jgi:hypothetical protein
MATSYKTSPVTESQAFVKCTNSYGMPTLSHHITTSSEVFQSFSFVTEHVN